MLSLSRSFRYNRPGVRYPSRMLRPIKMRLVRIKLARVNCDPICSLFTKISGISMEILNLVEDGVSYICTNARQLLQYYMIL